MTTTIEQLKALGASARPVDDSDFGSERQINAENTFFDELTKAYPAVFDDAFFDFTFDARMTADEAITHALKVLEEKCA